jgi:hypothetical protein
MNRQSFVRVALFMGVSVLLPACGDDAANDGGSSSAANDETATGSDGESMSASASAEGADMDQGGDGDGDAGDGDGDGDAGDGDGDAGDGDGGDGDGEPCEESEAVLAPIPPSVMFLLDRSGSMNNTGFDMNDPDKSRWQALYESVDAVVSNGADATIAFGAKTFSTYNFGECGVSDDADVSIALNNSAAILAGIPGPLDFIVGGTPTNLAIDKTVSIMQAHDAMGGSKIVFLITDGGIGCTQDSAQSLADAVADLSSAHDNDGITTYVVGIAPTGSAIAQLHGMANAGGAPKPGLEAFYRADDAQQLATALADVVAASAASSCLLALEQPPQFPDSTKVIIGNTEYPLVDDCDNEDGFVFTDMDYTKIRVCGAACDQLQIEQQAAVQLFCELA